MGVLMRATFCPPSSSDSPPNDSPPKNEPENGPENGSESEPESSLENSVERWPDTPFGPVPSWPASLKTALSICINSHFPMVVWWGKDFRLLYNDAFIPILGDRHPQALGQPAQSVFSESWHIIGPQLNSVFETKKANRADNLLIPVLRSGYLEESYYTYSYSPLLTKAGTVKGVFTIINETTKQVIGDRRLMTSTRLAAQAPQAQTSEEMYRAIIDILSDNPTDIPFAALYRLNPAKTKAILCGQVAAAEIGAEIGNVPLLPVIDFDQTDPWQFETVLHAQQAITIQNLPDMCGSVPSGLFGLPVMQVRVLPIRAASLNSVAGLLVMGLNPARPIDTDYVLFCDLLASNIASRFASVDSQRIQHALEVSEDKFQTLFRVRCCWYFVWQYRWRCE